MKKILSIILCIVMTMPTTTFAVASVVESPTLLTQLIKQYQQYVEMLEKAQNQIDKLNRANEFLRDANNLVRNAQINVYNPMEILENLKDTIEEMEHNAKALAKSVRDFDIRDRIAYKRIQAKCPEISERVKKMKYISNEDDSDGETQGERNKESYTAQGEETEQDALLKEYLEEFTNITLNDINSVTSSIRGLPQAILLCQSFYQNKLEAQIKEQENKVQKALLENDFNAYKESQAKKFDRDFANNERIPFMSAMTLLGTNERDEKNIKSYIDIANKLDSNNKEELFRRMIFNTLFGNIDDHLRNHALLYDKTKRKWNLSPAYDLNPMPYEYTKQSHALAFKDCITTPSIELCKNLAKDFEVQDCKFYEILQDCISAGTQYKKIASDFGIKANEINLFANNFEHKDIVLANEMLEKEQLNKANILAKNTQTPQAHKPKPHRR